MIEYHALSGLTVTVGGQEASLGGPRQRRLLAVFLIHRNTVVSVDRLADAVFAGEPTPGANTTLRSYVARIRRVVADAESAPTVITQAPGYLMTVADDAFDVARFEHGVADAETRAADGDHAAAAASLRAALDLWQGEPYAEFADEDWARPEAQRLSELRLVAFERLFEAELELGRADTLVPEIEGLVEANPTREGLRAQLMVALYRAGRQADALHAFQELRRDLRDELGLDPTPALVDLERRLLAQDPTLLVVEPAGQRLRGYVLGERLGTGRDGTVFAARLPGVDRELAIRVVHTAVADSPEFVRSFESTTRRIASLDHPAIVPIHDYWREPGAAYLVMRRLHGGSLTDRLTRGPLSVDEVARLVDRVGGALLAAGEAGLAHGRVSPDSVLYDDSGDPVPRRLRVGRHRGRRLGPRRPRPRRPRADLPRGRPGGCGGGIGPRRRPERSPLDGRVRAAARRCPRRRRSAGRPAAEPLQGPAGLRRGRRRRLLRACRRRRRGPAPAGPGRTRGPTGPRGRWIGYREVQRRTGGRRARGAGGRAARVGGLVRHHDAPRRHAVRRPGREPAPGGGRRVRRPGRGAGRRPRSHRPGDPPGRPRRRSDAAAGGPVRGIVHVGDRP